MRLPLLISALGLLVACGHPQTLQYDHGSTYHAAMSMQADLDRESASDATYDLTGEEALKIRVLVTESSTDSESANTTLDLDVK